MIQEKKRYRVVYSQDPGFNLQSKKRRRREEGRDGERGRNRDEGRGRREEEEEKEVGWINDSTSKGTAVTFK